MGLVFFISAVVLFLLQIVKCCKEIFLKPKINRVKSKLINKREKKSLNIGNILTLIVENTSFIQYAIIDVGFLGFYSLLYAQINSKLYSQCYVHYYLIEINKQTFNLIWENFNLNQTIMILNIVFVWLLINSLVGCFKRIIIFYYRWTLTKTIWDFIVIRLIATLIFGLFFIIATFTPSFLILIKSLDVSFFNDDIISIMQQTSSLGIIIWVLIMCILLLKCFFF